MLTNVKSLKDYLITSLKLPEDCIEVYSADGTAANPGKYLTTLLKEYGFEKPDVTEGIKIGATAKASVTETIESAARRCHFPKECIKSKTKMALFWTGIRSLPPCGKNTTNNRRRLVASKVGQTKRRGKTPPVMRPACPYFTMSASAFFMPFF